MNRWLLALPLAIFGLSGIALYMLWSSQADDTAFRDNLLPELIGFCLEGFFLIGLLSMIQARREKERKEELRLSLRGALRDILSHLDIALLGETAEPAGSGSLEHDPRLVATLIMKLADNTMDVDAMARLKLVAGRNLTTIHDLIPVAAQLSAKHMRWWLAIIDSVRQLSEATDSSAVMGSMHRFLANLGEFDQLEV